MLSQPEPIPSTTLVAISTLPTGLEGGFLWGPVDWPGSENQRMITAFPLQTPPSDPGNVLICFPSSGATVEVAKSDLVIPSPILAMPKP